jgi:hypothetical protein
MSDKKLSITFFSSASKSEQAALEPIAWEAERRGYLTTFSTDVTEDAEIGVYNTHVYPDATVAADHSVVIVNSVDDGYDPDYFWRERWNRFDVGLLSGETVGRHWQSVSGNKYARPRRGVYVVGWPKSDWVHTEKFARAVDGLRGDIELIDGRTAVYAPAEESAGKMVEYLDAIDGLVDTMLIKHKGHERYSHIREREFQSELIILDHDRDIFESLAIADVVISEQSSVLPEALHTNTLPISVADWPVTFSSGTRYPGDTLPDFVETTTREELRSTIKRFYDGDLILDIERIRDRHFAHPGQSAKIAMDVIEDVVVADGNHPSQVTETGEFPGNSNRDLYYSYVRATIEKSLPPAIKEWLLEFGAGQIMMRLDDILLSQD